MMEKRDFIEKGFYHHPTPSDTVVPKQYMIVEKDGKKCLLLRFVNEFEGPVSGMEFFVTELDNRGEVINTSTVKVPDVNIKPGDTFAHPRGIVLSDKCADFHVTVSWFISDAFKYTVRHGQTVAHFDVRGFDLGRKKRKMGAAPSVHRRRLNGGAVGRLVAFLAIVLIIAAVGLSIYSSQREFGKFDSFDSSDASQQDD